jgi:threonine/homoserine/homoserine lactone efflux protein
VSGSAALIGYGFLLGWSVAWPPGPINAEMIRRGLGQGFLPAVAVGLGACSGDALWAVAVLLGIGLIVGDSARLVLAFASTILLILLAALFLKGAWQAWTTRENPPLGHPGTTRSGYLLGLMMALTSPWNLAFWLAVMGRPQSLDSGPTGAFVVAAAVILGAGTWCVVLCTVTTRLRTRFGGPVWQIVARAATGLLMLGFALQQIRELMFI